MANFDLLIRGGTVVTPNGTEQSDVAVLDGRIGAIGNLANGSAETTIEAKWPIRPARHHRYAGPFSRARLGA